MIVNDTQRPRFVRLTAKTRAEIDYSTGTPSVIDVVNTALEPLARKRLLEVAKMLGIQAKTELGALRGIDRIVRRRRALRRVVRALSARDAAERHVEIAEQYDVDAEVCA